MERYRDTSGVSLMDGNVVRTPRSINGISIFYIRSIQRQQVYFIRENGAILKYTRNEGLKGIVDHGSFRIINVGLAHTMSDIFEDKMNCEEALKKCAELSKRDKITMDQEMRLSLIKHKARERLELSRTDFYNILKDVIDDNN